jgi:hypothetical protein
MINKSKTAGGSKAKTRGGTTKIKYSTGKKVKTKLKGTGMKIKTTTPGKISMTGRRTTSKSKSKY